MDSARAKLIEEHLEKIKGELSAERKHIAKKDGPALRRLEAASDHAEQIGIIVSLLAAA